MSARLFDTPTLRPCRVCGAARAQYAAYDMCDTCWEEYGRKKHMFLSPGLEETDVINRFLIHKLGLTTRRLQRGQLIYRCEAVSRLNATPRPPDQCAFFASGKRDGRWVCTVHQRQKQITFIDFDIESHFWQAIENQFADFARADARCAEVMRRALEKAK